MNSKGYDSFFTVWLLFLVFILIFVITFVFIVNSSSIRKYQMVSGLVSSKNQVMLLVSSEQLEWFRHNKVILIDGKKANFSIERELRNISSKKNKKIHQVFLDVSTDDYSINNPIVVGVLQKRVSFLSVFFEIWKGG